MNSKRTVILGLIMLMAVISLSAKTYYVSADGNDGRDGLTASTAYATFDKAISVASESDVIVFTGTIQLGHTVNVASGKKIVIEGSDSQMGNNVIDGCGKCGLFDVAEGASLTLRNMVLRGGIASQRGAAVSVDHGTLTVERCDIYNNKTAFDAGCKGGAIYAAGSTLSIVGTAFYGNKSYQGGAVFVENSQLACKETTFEENETHLDDVTVTRPSEARGGALMLVNSRTNIGKSSFFRNLSSGDGGAICVLTNSEGCWLDIDGCAIVSNKTGLGSIGGMHGGAFMYMVYKPFEANVRSTTIALNLATTAGGALFYAGDAEDSKLNFVNCTIFKNSTLSNSGNGGGLNINNRQSAVVNIVNSIVEGNKCAGGGNADVVFGSSKNINQYNSSVGTGQYEDYICPQMNCQYRCFPLMPDGAWTTSGSVSLASEYGCLSDQNGFAITKPCIGSVQALDGEPLDPGVTKVEALAKDGVKGKPVVVDVEGRVLNIVPEDAKLVKRANNGMVIIVK